MQKYTIDDLTDKQQQFVEKFIAAGGDRSAGIDIVLQVYDCVDRRSASSTLYRLLHNDKIKDVLADRTVSEFAPLAVLATSQMKDVLETGMWHGQRVKPETGLKIMAKVLDRGLGSIIQHHEHKVRDERSRAELEAAVRAKIEQLPPEDRAKLLAEGVIDADFEEVLDPAAPRGRKKDGTARQPPGPQPWKRRLTGPDAHTPRSALTDVEKVREQIKKKKAAALAAALDTRDEDA